MLGKGLIGPVWMVMGGQYNLGTHDKRLGGVVCPNKVTQLRGLF